MEGALITRDESTNDSVSNEADWYRLLTLILKIENTHCTIKTKAKGNANNAKVISKVNWSCSIKERNKQAHKKYT